jgi:hypothetical protein
MPSKRIYGRGSGRVSESTPQHLVGPGDIDRMSVLAASCSLPACSDGLCSRPAGHAEIEEGSRKKHVKHHPSQQHVYAKQGVVVETWWT